ncbi:MAG TPA: bifunctional enoyl-CoA hydratase/phosphate acetyltransferase [Clostridiaceae bacterium]|nr:bifunctional enoyl-CoA hydratase/phosphate acetyltransferase [Clostridiaceae bacterium]
MGNRFQKIIDRVIDQPDKKRCAVVCPDEVTVRAALEAERLGLVDPFFFFDELRLDVLSTSSGLLARDGDYLIVDTPEEAARAAVKCVRKKEMDMLLKGNIDTAVLLRQVVNKEYGLTTGRLITHVAFLDVPAYHKMLIVTDGGMVTYPTLEQKRSILENAVFAMRSMGVNKPKVACLAVVEKVHENMPETLDAAELKAMNERGEIIDCIVEGPISFDLAFSREAASMKRYESPVAGDADILLVPDFVVGNLVAKAMMYTGNSLFAGVLVGASAPVIITSRSSTSEEKVNSIACSALLARAANAY